MSVEKVVFRVNDADPHDTDLGNAIRLVTTHGKDLRYIAKWGKWFSYDDRCGVWREDETGEIMRKMKAVILSEHATALVLPDGDIRNQKLKHFTRSESEPSLRRAVTLAQSDISTAIRHDDLDRDPWLLNVLNGCVNLRTGELQPHRRENLCTKASLVPYSPTATCPRWDRFLKEVFLDRKDLMSFIHRAVGYSLTGETREHAIFIAHGIGANGKTTFFEALRPILGDYATNIEATTLLANNRDGAPRNDIARLVGSRMVTAAEIGEGKRLDESLIKSISGGDRVTARFLHQEFFEFSPQFKVWIATNHKPVIRGTDNGIWRRVKLLPFDAVFHVEQREEGLRETLAAEAPGILRWAVEGCIKWREDGLGSCGVIEEAVRQYRQTQDVIGSFIEDRCDVGKLLSDSGSRLYSSFKAWAEKNGEYVIRNRDFAASLEERGYQGERTKHGKCWTGLSVKVDDEQPEPA